MLSTLRKVSQNFRSGARSLATIQEVLAEQIPKKQAEMKELKKEFGSKSLGEVTVDQCIGGGRGVKCMYYETSLLDADEGIRFRGLSIPECQSQLPTFKGAPGDGEPVPEALIWLLLTSQVPTIKQTRGLTEELRRRRTLPSHVEPMIRAFPKGMHPMTQMTTALAACQTESKFAKAYMDGVGKADYWKYTLEDVLDVMAKLPEIAENCTFIFS